MFCQYPALVFRRTVTRVCRKAAPSVQITTEPPALHVAYYAPAWPPAGAANGIVTYVSVLRDYLLRQGHDVSVLADGTLHLSDGTSHVIDPVALPRTFKERMISRIDRRLGHHPFLGRRLASQLRSARKLVQFDLLEMEETFGWSRLIAKRVDVPVVTRLHGPQFLKPPGADAAVPRRHAAERERAEGRAIRDAQALTVPTAAMLAATCQHYRCPSANARVIPNPVAAAAPDERWQGDHCDPATILFVGRLDLAKGADTMIAAFARLAAQRPQARLMMVGPEGQAKLADGTLVPFLTHVRSVTAPDILARIEFTGLLPPERIGALRRRATVTVVASPNENFPYAAVEAMALGCPLISTDWPGADEIVADGISGWLTPVGDLPALSARLAWVLDHQDTAARVGANARRRIDHTFSAEAVGARMLDFYSGVLLAPRTA